MAQQQSQVLKPFSLRASLDRVDVRMEHLIYEAFPQAKAS